jgi:hypothetical protein
MLEQESFMQQRRLAGFGLTLAIASTAVWAAPGDAWHGTRDEDKAARPPLEAAPWPSESTTSLDARIEAPAAREYYAPEVREMPVEPPAPSDPNYDRRHPQTGQLIERGLFNKAGPNDFGA